MTEVPDTLPRWRTALVFVLSAAAAYFLYHLDGNVPVGVIVVVCSLLVAPFLNRMPTLAPQLFARAIWWQSAFLGSLVLFGTQRETAAFIALTAAGAALAAGRSGLSSSSTSFLPVMFRRTLMVSLVLAIADFAALALYGSIFFEEALTSSYVSMTQPLWFLVAAAAMAVSIFGLYRLKLWGLATCLVTNLAVATLAVTGVFDLPGELVFGLAATAVVQLLLPLPLIRRMVRTRRLA